MSRRLREQGKLSDETVYRTWSKEQNYNKAAAILGCSAQHVKNVRIRHEKAHPIILIPRDHYVDAALNNPPPYQGIRLQYALTPGHLMMIDINYLVAVVISICMIISSIKAPLLGLLLLAPILGLWHQAAEGGRYLREALKERSIHEL